ncbi:MAG: DNA primase [Treponema sp.]|jgi:DNA primase|nr:DNA primase [Treponema sp.]
MPFITQSSIQEVIDKMDAVAVMGDYVRLENRSGRFMGLCPFHNEKTPSFSVNPDLKLYHCFGCGKGGTVLNFIMEMDKLTFPEAVERLAKRFGVALQYEAGGNAETDKNAAKTEALFDLYSRVAGSFHYLLAKTPQGKPALTYTLSRGISYEMVEKFKLGYAPADREWLFKFLSKRGYSEEFLADSALFSRKHPRMSFFADRLIFPINDRQGRTAAFGGRLLSGDGPKYLNTSESAIYKKGQTLFAVDAALPEIKKTKEAYIAEGYMDVIALHQAGVTNAVAPLGTAFTDDQARLLRRFAERVNLIFDSDNAGQTAAVKGILTCRRNGLNAYIVTPGKAARGDSINLDESEGAGAIKDALKKVINMKDPADILKEFGREVLKNCVKSVILDLDYLIARSKELYNTNVSEGKFKAAAFVFSYLETLDSDVIRDNALGQLADALRVDREAVRNDYNNRRTNVTARHSATGTSQDQRPHNVPLRMNEELFLLAVVAVNDSLYSQFRARLSIEEIEDPAAKDIFIALEECFVHDETGLDALLPRINSENARKFIVERGVTTEFSSNPEQLVSDGIKRIKQKRIERRSAKIVTELRLIEGNQNKDENTYRSTALDDELLLEKMHIDAELRKLKENKE